MAKARTFFSCQSCGHSSYKWLGRCPECGGWNSFVEEREQAARPRAGLAIGAASAPQPIAALDVSEEQRVSTGMPELDRVLGGGLVRGSAVLIGGDPGIGKSTLLLQAMGRLAAGGHRVLYVSGEESMRQIRLRGERLGALSDSLLVYSETSVERILETVKETSPSVLVIDSVQTVYSEAFESSPGSVGQVREAAARLISYAKTADVPVFLVGHVTKDGAIAGPKVLEHMVDTVLYFEGERGHPFRILRAVKNRFGSVMEIGVFEMKEAGLAEVANPSEMFLAERPEGASGSAVVSSLEGTRTILVEVQSLVCPTLFGVPRRTVVGVDYNKVMLIAAVLEKKAGISLANHDIFIKVAGGMRLEEPAIDLGILASITSNFLDKPIEPRTVIFGEVGLAGEVRAINQVEQRVKEAAKLGFTRSILPKDNLKGLKKTAGMGLTAVSTVKEAIEKFF
ncbi:MAG: DNA repair protein RadA [Deltaproteobacteria bacterium]|nr:DNA repair protein RadA [Deltaproteobacteria bacterium]